MATKFTRHRSEDAAVLDHLINLLMRFREENPEATLNQVISFFAIAREPYITQKQLLSEVLSMKTSGQSRIVSVLSKHGDSAPGWNVIKLEENPLDRREKLLSLTSKGQMIINSTLEHVRGACRAVHNRDQRLAANDDDAKQ